MCSSDLEAVIHVLDRNLGEPILNNNCLELTENTYSFIYNHIKKCFKNPDLKTAVFLDNNNHVKELTNIYLNESRKTFLDMSKDLALKLFPLIRGNVNIASCDLLIVSLVTDIGPMVGILKLDLVETFTHHIKALDESVDISIIKANTSLPVNQKIQKAAFININNRNKNDLLILDNGKKHSKDEEYGTKYFIDNFLECAITISDRDLTRDFLKASENWTRANTDDVYFAESIRNMVKDKVIHEDVINVDDFSRELFDNQPALSANYAEYIKSKTTEDNVVVDKVYAESHLKNVKLKLDNTINLSLDTEIYNNPTKFEIVSNEDGTVNIVIKYISSCIRQGN